jgi:hypothetical protein
MLMDGVTWDRLLETLALYGYATADVLNAGSDGGFFLHSMTITPLVDTDPSSINGADVALAGHVVRSKVSLSAVRVTRRPCWHVLDQLEAMCVLCHINWRLCVCCVGLCA